MKNSLLSSRTKLLVSTTFCFLALTLNAQKLASGNNHAIMICTDGLVQGYGDNNFGQVGDGTNADKEIPVSVNNITNAVQVAAGFVYSHAVDGSNNLWSWGGNAYGQLGNDSSGGTFLSPIIVMDSVLSIACGGDHSLALMTDGTVRAWGKNTNGQLGRGFVTTLFPYSEITPGTISGLSNIIMVTAGENFSAALDQSGNVYTWGENVNGQLGLGTTSDTSSPVMVSGLSNIMEISAGADHLLALDNNGDVWAMGYDKFSQCDGTGNLVDSLPVLATFGKVKVYADKTYSFAIDTCGTTYSWGGNQQYGQSGNGSAGLYSIYPPEEVSVVTDRIREIYTGVDYAIAVTEKGEVFAWGEHPVGLGDIDTILNRTDTSVFVNVTCTVDTISISVKDSCGEVVLPAPTAYNGTPHPIPGKIEAEEYGEGGQGVAYNDVDGQIGTANPRNDDVDMENCADDGGGYNIGWVVPGEWLRYVVDVQDTGTAQIDIRVASMNGGGTVKVSFEKNGFSDEVTFDDTGGWQDWITVTLDSTKTVFDSTGEDIMRVDIVAGEFNLNYVEVRMSGDSIVGVENKYFNNTKVYPNPFDNVIQLTVNENSVVDIYSITGTKVYSGVISKGENTINLTDKGVVLSGLYFMKITHQEYTETIRLIKK